MSKTAKYWHAFTAKSRTQAEKAAAAWWAEQNGFDRVSGWTLPAEEPSSDGTPQWTVTIVYRPSGLRDQAPTLH